MNDAETLRAAAARLRSGDTFVPLVMAWPLADWLNKEAAGWELMSAVNTVTITIGGGTQVQHSTVPEALAVAHIILDREA